MPPDQAFDFLGNKRMYVPCSCYVLLHTAYMYILCVLICLLDRMLYNTYLTLSLVLCMCSHLAYDFIAYMYIVHLYVPTFSYQRAICDGHGSLLASRALCLSQLSEAAAEHHGLSSRRRASTVRNAREDIRQNLSLLPSPHCGSQSLL